jgi:hypothetical protein
MVLLFIECYFNVLIDSAKTETSCPGPPNTIALSKLFVIAVLDAPFKYNLSLFN